jgi:predicted Zn-dependent protease
LLLAAFLQPWVLATGCAQSASIRAWTHNQGGVLRDSRQPRIDRIAARILPESAKPKTSVQVLASIEPSAFSWPSGKVFVTRGLVDLLDDDELAAAIAHELGHLLGDGHVKESPGSAVASLRGCQTDFDAESRADAMGVNLLRAKGIPEKAMGSMLEKVRVAGQLPVTCKSAISRRVELLRAQ